MTHSNQALVTDPYDPPGGRLIASATPDTPQDAAELYAKLHVAMQGMYASERNYADADAGLVAEATSIVRQLARLGPQAVLDAGLACMIETTVMLTLRTQAAILWHVGVIDRSGGGHRGKDALSLPREVQALLPAMTDLGSMVIRLSEAYAKYRHVISLTENKCDIDGTRSTNGRKKMGSHSGQAGRPTWDLGTPGISGSNGADHRSVLRDPIPIGG